MKLGRNEKCHCGSNNKYKHCCLGRNTIQETSSMSPYPIRFFGYNCERPSHQSPLTISEDGLVCMVSEVTQLNQDPVNEGFESDFKIGEWFLSWNSCETIECSGPYTLAEEAFEVARVELGAIRFNQETT